MSKTMHVITVEEDGQSFVWASMNGEDWMPINRKPKAEDAPAVEDLFRYKEEVKDDGTVVWKGHITAHRLHFERLKRVPGVTITEEAVALW